MLRNKPLVILTLSTFGFLPEAAFAQDGNAPVASEIRTGETSEADAAETGLVIVTARRREEMLQDVPISISVASQEELTRRNIQSIGDLQIAVPSLTTGGPYRNTPLVSIRGQGGYTPGGIPSVILYMNDVPFATSAQAGSPGGALGANGLFYDLQNVQVAKGPQGTLFGRNTTGGAILIQSRRPEYDFGGHVTLTAGNYDDREFDAAVNVPLVADAVAVRIAANGQRRDGFTVTQSTPSHPDGLDLDDTRHVSVRGSVLASLGAMENLLVADYLKVNHNGVSSILRGVNPSPQHPINLFFPGLAELVPVQDALGIRSQVPLSTDTRGFLRRRSITNTTTIDLSDAVTLKNIIAYSRAKYAQTIDGDGTAFPIFDPIQSQAVPYVTRQFTEEVQLQSESLGGKLEWVAGFFYLKQPEEDDFTLHRNVTFGTARDVGYKQFESSKAIFAQGDLAFTDRFSATLGLRYTWETIGRATREVYLDGTCFSPFAGSDCILANSDSFEEPTWTIGLNYEPNADTLLYVVSRRGFRSGGFNLDGDTPADARVYGEETVTDLELGAKASFGLGAVDLTANIAAYRQWYGDIQLLQTSRSAITNGPLNVIKNAGEAEIDGIEFEGSARVTNLTLHGHFNFIDFDYTKFDPDVILPISPMMPEFAFGVGARYLLPVPDRWGELSLAVNYDWQDHSRVAPYEDPFAPVDAYGILTFGADWRNAGGSPFDVSFFMTNATDEEYVRGGLPIFNALGLSALTYGAPRMYGLRVGMRFGADAD